MWNRKAKDGNPHISTLSIIITRISSPLKDIKGGILLIVLTLQENQVMQEKKREKNQHCKQHYLKKKQIKNNKNHLVDPCFGEGPWAIDTALPSPLYLIIVNLWNLGFLVQFCAESRRGRLSGTSLYEQKTKKSCKCACRKRI